MGKRPEPIPHKSRMTIEQMKRCQLVIRENTNENHIEVSLKTQKDENNSNDEYYRVLVRM